MSAPVRLNALASRLQRLTWRRETPEPSGVGRIVHLTEDNSPASHAKSVDLLDTRLLSPGVDMASLNSVMFQNPNQGAARISQIVRL